VRRAPDALRVKVDAREHMKPGAKYYDWEMRGVPLRMELGPRDLDAGQRVLVPRDTKEKKPVSLDTVGEEV
jgi:prolyl-tRNA synthetase